MALPYKRSSLSAELLALRDKNGLINPREVVTWAKRHPNSALYRELEWDNETAGEEWRVQQVRQLIAVFVVDNVGDRRLVSLSIDRAQGGGYRNIEDVMGSADLRAVMLNDALEELNRMQRKYQHLTELVDVWQAADALRKRGRRGPKT